MYVLYWEYLRVGHIRAWVGCYSFSTYYYEGLGRGKWGIAHKSSYGLLGCQQAGVSKDLLPFGGLGIGYHGGTYKGTSD